MQLEEFVFHRNARKEELFLFSERSPGKGGIELVIYHTAIRPFMRAAYKYRLKVTLSPQQKLYFSYGEDGSIILKNYQPEIPDRWAIISGVIDDFNNLSDQELNSILNSFRTEE